MFVKNIRSFMKAIITSILLFVFCETTFSQNYVVEKFTIEDRLPGNFITDIEQDSLGQIWIASDGNIAFFNGLKWTTADKPQKFGEPQFVQIEIDETGAVWCVPRLRRFTIYKYSNNNWSDLDSTNFNFTDNHIIAGFTLLKAGSVYIPVVAVRNFGIIAYRNSNWEIINRQNGLPSLEINSLIRAGNKIFVCLNGGIVTIDENLTLSNEITSKYSLSQSNIYTALIKKNNVEAEYILTDKGLYKTTGSKKQQIGKTGKIIDGTSFTYNLVRYNRFILLIGGIKANYLFDVRDNRLLQVGEENGLLEDGTNKILVDREKAILFGRYAGLSEIPSLDFISFDLNSKLRIDDVSAIEQFDDSLFIFGANGGYDFFNINDYSIEHIRPKMMKNGRIAEITKDADGRFWIAAGVSGLFLLNKDKALKKINLADNIFGVQSVLPDEKNRVLAATARYLMSIKKGRSKIIIDREKLGVRTFRRIYFDEGKYYLCTSNGVFSSEDLIEWTAYKSSESRGNNTYCFYHDNLIGRLVGTSGGMYLIENDSLTLYRHGEIKIEEPTYFISKDVREDYWFGTGNGIYRWSGSQFIHYTASDGIAGVEANRDAFFADSLGRVLFGTETGLTIFRGEYDRFPMPTYARIVISKIYADKSELNPNISNSMEHDLNNISIDFEIHTTVFPESYTFYIKLDGANRYWTKLQDKKHAFVNYPGLQPGDYKFKIKAVDIYGRTTPVVSSGQIIILKPFYERTWFVAVSILLFVGLMFLIIRYYLNARYSENLKRELKTREKELFESTERFSQFFLKNRSILLLLDSQTFTIIDANESAQEFYGYSHNELIGMSFVSLFKEELYSPITSDDGTMKSYIVAQHKLAGGETKFVEIYSTFSALHSGGAVFIIVHDITSGIKSKRDLEEAEKLYRSVIENLQDGLFMIADDKFTLVNKAFADIVGYTTEELIGSDYINLVSEDSREITNDRYQRRRRGEKVPNQYVINLTHKSGEKKMVNLHVSVLNLMGTLYSIGTVKDITEAHKQREALKESEQRYKSLFENNTVGIYRSTPDGKIEIANQAFAEMLGFGSFEGIRNLHIKAGELYSGFDRDAFKEKIEKNGYLKAFETKLTRKDGTEIYVRESARLVKDSNGKSLYYEGVIEDITSSKTAYRNLELNEKKLQNLLNSIADPIFEISYLGTIHEIRNETVLKGIYDVDNLPGKNIVALLPEELKNTLRDMLMNVPFSPKQKLDYSVETPAGRKHFEMRIIKYDENTLLAVLRDITERVMYEEKIIEAKQAAERAEKMKQNFLAQMSHEVRTPLHYINSFIGLLKDSLRGKLSETELNYLSTIDKGKDRLIDTIESILNQSDFSAGSYEPKFELFNLANELMNIWDLIWKDEARRKSLIFSVKNSCENGFIRGDKNTVLLMIKNIVKNSLIYTEKGKVELVIDSDDNNLIISVEDTGIGIDKSYLPNIFKPFSQEDAGYSRTYEGIGLGLSLAKSYADLNNAEIQIESEKDKGTKFTIKFKNVNV